MSWFWLPIAVFAVAWLFSCLSDSEWTGVFGTFFILVSLVFGIKSCSETEWYIESKKREAAREAADQQPRVVREIDGCKVYAFKSGERWHYFTRCPDSRVSTDTNHTVTVKSGKSTSTKTETTTIVTENK
jgi:hypothetical protein